MSLLPLLFCLLCGILNAKAGILPLKVFTKIQKEKIMKKVLLTIALFAGIVSAHAVESFRLDLRGVKDVTMADIQLSEGMKIAVQAPKGVKEGITRAFIYSDDKKLTAEYQKFTVSFMPEEDGRVTIFFHTPGSRNTKNIVPVIIDDVQVTGARFQNGGFETLKNGAIPAAWRFGKNAKLLTSGAAEGKNCAQTFYGSGIVSQNLYVTTDEKVTVTFQAKLAK